MEELIWTNEMLVWRIGGIGHHGCRIRHAQPPGLGAVVRDGDRLDRVGVRR